MSLLPETSYRNIYWLWLNIRHGVWSRTLFHCYKIIIGLVEKQPKPYFQAPTIARAKIQITEDRI